MASLCFEHRLNAEPAPPSRQWRAALGGPVREVAEQKRQTWPRPHVFGLDEHMVWTRGGPVEAKVDWMLLTSWRVEDDWLILSVTGLPRLYYPLSTLREKGLYKQIMNRLSAVSPKP